MTWELTRRDIQETYAAHLLGGAWSIAHPLIMMAVYLAIFGFVFQSRTRAAGGGDDYALFLFAGLVPWLLMQQSLNRSTDAVVSESQLVKQVVFPVEVLVVKGVLSTLISGVVPFFVVAAYAFYSQGRLSWTWLLVPLLLLLQVVAMIGLGYMLSALVVFVRDLKEVVRAGTLIGTYLTPIFFRPDWVPKGLGFLLYFNPFSYLVWCYQDACFHGRIVHPWAWVALIAFAVAGLAVGGSVFTRLKPDFANVL